MTKHIPLQSRVSGPFDIAVNGVTIRLTAGADFTDTAALLGALDGAGIAYEALALTAATGTASGRIRILGTGATLDFGLNGVTTKLPVNTWFTPADGVIELLTNAGRSYETEYTDQTPSAFSFTDATDVTASSTQTSNTITVAGLGTGITVAVSITGGTYSKNGGSYVSSAGTATNGDTFAVRHTASASSATAVNTVLTIGGVSDTFTSTTTAALTPGPEIWPQPTFAASTGLTLTRCSISSNALTTNGSGTTALCAMSTPPTILAGDQYQYSVTVSTNLGEDIKLQIGGGEVNFGPTTGTFTGTLTVDGTQTFIRLTIANDGAEVITACSVKKLS